MINRDIAIQSQIQSPLVRTLQSIPTNSSNFVHGIPDNTPPFSKQQIKIKPSEGTPSILNDRFRFKIPQNGHLNRMYLRYRMYGHVQDNDKVLYHDSDSPFSFAEGIEWIRLETHNEIIQTMYGSAIPFDVSSMSRSDEMTHGLLQGLAGYTGVSESGQLMPIPTMNEPTLLDISYPQDDNKRLVVKDYLIPIPLSSTFYLKDNLQTRLMEDLELVVQTRASPTQVPVGDVHGTQFSTVDEHDLELVVDYINYHENVEEVIRNENFKPDIPASLLQSDNLLFKARHRSESNAGSGGREQLYTVDLNTDALVSDIYVVPRVFSTNLKYARYHSFRTTGFVFELVSNGEVIMSGFKKEFDGIESMHYSTVTRQYQNEGVFPLRWAPAGTHIRLALNNTDEYFDGGISFQSLVNPQLRIKLVYPAADPETFYTDEGSAETRSVATAPYLIEFDVVLKRKVMLRIDGNTGKISKSLES